MNTLPLILAYVGIALMLIPSGVGSAVGTVLAGNATVAAMKKNPNIFGSSMILSALPSTQGLYGFAAFFLNLGAINGLNGVLTMNQALAVLAAGTAMGVVGLISAIKQAHSLTPPFPGLSGSAVRLTADLFRYLFCYP